MVQISLDSNKKLEVQCAPASNVASLTMSSKEKRMRALAKAEAEAEVCVRTSNREPLLMQVSHLTNTNNLL